MCPTRTLVCGAALAALLAITTGCGKRLYPVEGVVVFDDGSPDPKLNGGTVSLESVANKSNASGQIGRDGTFQIRGPSGEDGVPAGSYRVLVHPPEGADRRNPLLDSKYSRYETSGVEIAVTEGSNKVTVTVSRPKDGKKN
jgi:hypothetical protein